MASFSQTIVMGNVGKDPKITTFQSGDRIASFSIATSESWKDKNTGEKREKTEWHNIVIKNDGLSGVVEQYVKKGSRIMVVGQNQTRKWTDQNGAEKYTTEVVVGFGGTLKLMGDPPGERGERNDDRGGGSYGRSGNPNADRRPAPADVDDDIPF